jgi:hypothetical protein
VRVRSLRKPQISVIRKLKSSKTLRRHEVSEVSSAGQPSNRFSIFSLTIKMRHGGKWRGSCHSTNRDIYRSCLHRFVRRSFAFWLIMSHTPPLQFLVLSSSRSAIVNIDSRLTKALRLPLPFPRLERTVSQIRMRTINGSAQRWIYLSLSFRMQDEVRGVKKHHFVRIYKELRHQNVCYA